VGPHMNLKLHFIYYLKVKEGPHLCTSDSQTGECTALKGSIFGPGRRVP